MNYTDTLQYLYTQLPMFQRVGKQAFKKNLDNIIALCNALQKPQDSYATIHIAGTNGKGSTAHLLAASLQAKGLKVGLYTSPHYRDFRERIKINGQYISEQAVIDFVEESRPIFENIRPSFFEITVAMAFDYFRNQKVDIAIIETGLGGRLDSTNIITPILSIITNISFDHQQFLGNTLESIATEKAGIIKPTIPVVIGETQTETSSVFEVKAKELNASIYFADQHYKARLNSYTWQASEFDISKNDKLWIDHIPVGLWGNYQSKNIATTLQAIELLNKQNFDITEDDIRFAFANIKTLTTFIGRWEVLGQKPLILADSGHNEAGVQLIVKQLETVDYQDLHIVLGVVKDKDLQKVLPLFPQTAHYYFVKPDIPRGLDAQSLQQSAKQFERYGQAYSSVKEGLEAAKKAAKKEDLIFIGGSTFVVAEVV